MKQRNDSQNYRDIFLSDTPMMDVRAPVEYNKGAFPNTVNIPLLDDQQREAVGLRYKQQGQDAAIELGWKLATPEIKQQRLQSWQQFIQQHPEGYLYCFRGGLRSRLSQQLLKESGIDYPLITGGYKAMRRFLIDELDRLCNDMSLLVIGGRTGSGKTLALKHLSQAVDLEGLANHRGSAFGKQITPQPSQIDFENAVSIAVMKQRKLYQHLVMEDESRLIGRLNMPVNLRDTIHAAPLVVLETPIEERVNIVLDDYVSSSFPEYLSHYGEEQGRIAFREQILGNLERIKKRLGHDRYQQLQHEFNDALTVLEQTGNPDGFRGGIELLLTDYYDPMYDYQQSQRQGREVYRGSMDDIIQWINRHQIHH